MSDAPEIPEAKDPFETRVALTIAIMAICLSFVDNLGDNAKTDAIIKTAEASNQWGYFQAKGIKGQVAAMEGNVISRLPGGNSSDEIARLKADAERYDSEKTAIKSAAENLQKEAAYSSGINDRCDRAALFLQIGVVICSVAILARSHKFWYAGIILGVIGSVFGVLAWIA